MEKYGLRTQDRVATAMHAVNALTNVGWFLSAKALASVQRQHPDRDLEECIEDAVSMIYQKEVKLTWLEKLSEHRAALSSYDTKM